MRVYAQKGHALSEAERLELGRLLLKAGYIAMLGKEKQGSTSRHYVEFYRKVELFGQKRPPMKVAASPTATRSASIGA